MSPNHVVSCEWHNNTVRWREGERLEHLWEERCDAFAERVAVDAADVVLTYAELDARANQLARHLIRAGVRPGERIGLLFDEAVQGYVGMLAVLKAKAAYVPLDVSFPPERLSYIVRDAGVQLVLSLSRLRPALQPTGATPVCVDEWEALISAEDEQRLSEDVTGHAGDELCYIIYTSGSTGRPKGVAIEHASICNFLRVAVEVYGVRAEDRVYQGLTIAFDFSVEEIWLWLLAGATLVPKPAGAALLGQELREFLEATGVTALCCVPTLLATIDEDVAGLRFLLVSGEACPHDLVVRWHRPGRRFLNVYGPTEATVSATWTTLHPDRPVILGVPLPTYSAVILDPERDEALPAGETGEIGIAGIGLARGYVNRPDLTERAFVRDFIGIDGNSSGRIYRTGDLGRLNADGEIEYHGRIDTQVKIRGYRIELAEIESVVLQVPNVAQAVVDTYEPEPGVVELVAYYSPRGAGAALSDDQIYAHLRAHLPGYMVPAYLEEVAIIPMLPSGKADRKGLPAPRSGRRLATQQMYVDPETETETLLADALAETLGLARVSVESHFFDDLGANSLLMARFCATVRGRANLRSLSMKDVYLHPSVRTLAAALAALAPGAADSEAEVEAEAGARAGSAAYVACGALQLVLFLASVYLGALLLVAGYNWVSAGSGPLDHYVRALAFSAATLVGFSVTPVLAKWILIGRWKPVEIRIWSAAYLRFWFVKILIRSSPFVLFVGSPLYVLYLKALGARIGRGVAIFSRTVPVCTDLLTIGEGTVIRKDAFFTCYRAFGGMIQTGTVTIGRDAFVGEKTVIDIGASLGDGAQLGHTSSLQADQRVPAGTWHGSPAQRTDAQYQTVAATKCSTRRKVCYSTLQLAALVLVIPLGLTAVGAFLPDILSAGIADHTSWTHYRDLLAITFLAFFGGVVGGLILVVAVPRLLNLALTPGRVYPLYGVHYAIHRTIARMTNAKLYTDLFGDSSYIVHYLRPLGYDLSRLEQTGSNFGTELQHESPFLSAVGTGTMVSDALSLMNAEFSSSSFRVSRVAIGERNFLGNNIAFPPGARTGDNCLLATKVMVPINGDVRHDVGLLGSPCFEIPRTIRRDTEFDAYRNGDELRRRLAAKNRHNLVSMALFLLTRWFQFFCIVVIASGGAGLLDEAGAAAIAAASVLIVVFSIAYSVLIERAVTGFRPLRPQFCSLYDCYFWWHERLWKLIASARFNGTPFKNVIWRLLGVRVGRRVFDNGCEIPEKTLVSIGDDCTLNEGSVIQCHSLEEGTFKSDYTTIGARCTLGIESFVHYGVTVRDGAILDADSFLMKGEEIPPQARWRGNPAREIRNASRPRTAATAAVVTGAPTPTSAAPSSVSPSLLDELRAAPTPQLSQPLGVVLSLFSLEACRRCELELSRLLPEAEKEEATSLSSNHRRTAFVISRALLRLILSTEWRRAIAPRDWRFGRTDFGKLTIRSPADTGLDLSVSHSESAVAVALSDVYDVGVDLEPTTGRCGGVVWSVLSASERRRLAGTPVKDRLSDFVRIWTLKEAFVKCTGIGACLSFECLDTSLQPLTVVGQGVYDRAASECWFRQEKWAAGEERHWVAVAARTRSQAARGPLGRQ